MLKLFSLFSFSGRIGCVSWWVVSLGLPLLYLFLIFLSFLPIEFLDNSTETDNDTISTLFLWTSMVSLALVDILSIPMGWIILAASVKRYHDLGKSGFWVFIAIIPVIGWVWQMVELGFFPGDDGDNDYGSPPKAFENKTLSEPKPAPNRLGRVLAEKEKEQEQNTKPQRTIVTAQKPSFGKKNQ